MRFILFVWLLVAALLPSGISIAEIPAPDVPSSTDPPIFLGSVVNLGVGEYALVGCGIGMWPDCELVTAAELGVSELQMLVWSTHGTTIYIFGKWADEPDETGCFREVEAAKSTLYCGGGVANERLDWGSLKASYR
ncbi:hypothetical protein H8E07_09430 [bacterium]|nr:hypothetical protein [bacterium]